MGRFGVRVSEVGLGGWLTHGRTLKDDVTASVVRTALDAGINFFDTADAYNGGEAEKSLGIALKGVRRDDVVIGTKCFFPMSEKPNDRGLSRKHITEAVHGALARLQTDYIDMMQFHRYDAETPLDETVRAIEDLIRQGKVLYWGVSQWSAVQITDAVHLAERLIANPPASNQPLYNMLERGIEESVLPTCEKFGLGLVVFSPLAQGILTGKYLPGQSPAAGTRGADDTSNMFMGRFMTPEVLERVQKLKAYTEDLGVELPAFALAWCLRQKQVSSVIIGATRPEQVTQNVKASGLSFSQDVWERAEAILDGQ